MLHEHNFKKIYYRKISEKTGKIETHKVKNKLICDICEEIFDISK